MRLMGVIHKPRESITGHKFCSLRNWLHPTRKLLRTRLNGPAHGADEQKMVQLKLLGLGPEQGWTDPVLLQVVHKIAL